MEPHALGAFVICIEDKKIRLSLGSVNLLNSVNIQYEIPKSLPTTPTKNKSDCYQGKHILLHSETKHPFNVPIFKACSVTLLEAICNFGIYT